MHHLGVSQANLNVPPVFRSAVPLGVEGILTLQTIYFRNMGHAAKTCAHDPPAGIRT